MTYSEITTLGGLKKSGWKSEPVKLEIRRNLISKMKSGEQLFPGIIGYEKTVIPQLINAILSRHDIILLGLRGQGKTRILRMLTSFLDEYIPVIEGSEINDDPLNPLSKFGKLKVSELGDKTPISWLHRSQRFAEKLATPDTSVADLVGDLDPIKAATKKLALADEEVINFGLIPRTNRGIFAINELPDLQPRIQVALLNVMQERDIQIRGFNIRIPLDVMMVYSANPEDYTNRGNIITPLKDRIDSQIITHYPRSVDIGMKITAQEAWSSREDTEVLVPHFIKETVEQIAFEARESEYIDQKSGVSTRMTITAMEQIISAAESRALINNEKNVCIRISDLFHAVPALTGKLELVYEGEQEGAISVAKLLIGKAVNSVFKRNFPDPQKKKSNTESEYSTIIKWFSLNNVIELPDDLTEQKYKECLLSVHGLKDLIKKYQKSATQEEMIIWMDFVLEAMHQNSMLSKDDLDDARNFKDLVGSMLGSFEDDDELEY